MPKNKPQTYIAPIAYLQSYEVIKKLVDNYFKVDNHYFDNEFLSEIKANNASTHDLGMEDSYVFLKNELGFDALKIFDYFANRHLIIESGQIHICVDTLEEYFLLHTSIDTTPLRASFIYGYTDHLDDTNRLRYIDNHFNAPPDFYGRLEKKISRMSDNHIHLGGALDYEYRLHTILKSPTLIDPSKKPDELFVRLTECHIGIKNIILAISALETLLVECLPTLQDAENQTLRDLNTLLKALRSGNDGDIKYLSEKYSHSIRDRNNQEMFFTFSDKLCALFLNRAMHYFRHESIIRADQFFVLYLIKHLSADRLKEPIEIYFILRNILKVYIVQQHRREGFGYFSSYSSDNTIRRSKLPPERRHIMQSIYSTHIPLNIEGRITLQASEEALIESMIGYIIPFEQLRQKRGLGDRLKFMFHFIKQDDEEEPMVKQILQKEYISSNEKLMKLELFNTRNRWQSLREKIKREALVLNSLLTNPAYRKYDVSSIEAYKDDQTPRDFVGQYISGIDAASKEYHTPPEVFAPIYRFFKTGIETSGMVLTREYPYVDIENDDIAPINFQYSYHAGEDFRDILTGLRAIFETVVFLGLKENDRIGHALALGVDVERFLANREQRKLTKMEVLDDSIFAFYMLNKYPNDFTTSKERFRRKILDLSKEIYGFGNSDHITVDALTEAWFLRRNCPNEVKFCMDLFHVELHSDQMNPDGRRRDPIADTLFELKAILESPIRAEAIAHKQFVRAAIPDFFPYSDRVNFVYTDEYRSLRNHRTSYKLYWRYNTDQYVRFEGSRIYEGDFTFEPELYEFLQDVMMEEIIAKEDIIIETLPSSNLLIGQFRHYDEHPITRFKPVKETFHPNRFGLRTKKLRVVIGTDNPGLQNTTLLGELYQIKSALEKEYSKEEVERYLLEIVDEGNELFGR